MNYGSFVYARKWKDKYSPSWKSLITRPTNPTSLVDSVRETHKERSGKIRYSQM